MAVKTDALDARLIARLLFEWERLGLKGGFLQRPPRNTDALRMRVVPQSGSSLSSHRLATSPGRTDSTIQWTAVGLLVENKKGRRS